MASLIKPNRQEVSRAFPVLGFTVQTAGPRYFEVAVATDPALFGPEARSRRTISNFYSTRAAGAMPADSGHAVYLLPPMVLAGFAGQERLYYRLATFSGLDRKDPEIVGLSPEAIPFVYISKSFNGSVRRLGMGPDLPGRRLVEGNGYSRESPGALEWAGDAATPGQIEAAPPAQAPIASASTPTGMPVTTPPGAPQTAAVAYSDGFDDSFWARQQEAEDRAAAPDGGPEAAARHPAWPAHPWHRQWQSVHLAGLPPAPVCSRDHPPAWRLPGSRVAGVHRVLVRAVQEASGVAIGVGVAGPGEKGDHRLHRRLPSPAALWAGLPHPGRGRRHLAARP
jgi:hypothetical protein